MINHDHNHKVAAQILKNMGDECMAQSGYEALIYFMQENCCCEEDISIIREIESDERNHALKLFNLAQKYSGVKTTNDDSDVILAAIKDGFK